MITLRIDVHMIAVRGVRFNPFRTDRRIEENPPYAGFMKWFREIVHSGRRAVTVSRVRVQDHPAETRYMPTLRRREARRRE